ncbi:aminomethyl-transferring glycine dehydrogenase subunit GcvPB [Paradesulfitobacterium ferrireducens]|uniref:aminomethyl-transferring glycine dehydrogenase subunit GcvPB n=1 Tax=Paradesulfitobacterium ferrireducens TaxID=2816476 RepID=UPI001A8D2109|nr:aminomethyl-transferring glycine dehydrogenase subunit GcvPB [Paradesulfitobacterium ferrireducens]
MLPRKFHQARWDEPIIFEMSSSGERGILVPEVEKDIENSAGDVLAEIPKHMLRPQPPRLPELSQWQVLKHYLHLSQETMGADMGIDISLGTSTMKYSPKVNEQLTRLPQIAELHPLQDEQTIQGMLEVYYGLEQILKEISGMDQFTFQPSSGAQSIYTNASIIRKYHEAKGELDRRTEIITTIFSHPTDGASPATAGFKIITLMPGENGYPDLEALKAVVSERTSGLMITNPEDTGIYNPHIDEFVRVVHEAGGLCAYDQANANGVLGIARAREAGFDLCHFNLHKTFSSPHGSFGPGAGAVGVRKELAQFLPVPTVDFDGSKYFLNYDHAQSIGKVRGFFGVAPVVLRAYAWAMSLGAEGLRECAEISVLNNNYLQKKIMEIPGVTVRYADKRRLEQVRYSWEKLKEDTGVGTEDVARRIVDYGIQSYFTSHHPWVIPEPFTLEPCESYSKADMDEYVSILRQVAEEAYANPELVKNAPYQSTIHKCDTSFDDPHQWAPSWRAYLKKKGTGSEAERKGTAESKQSTESGEDRLVG